MKKLVSGLLLSTVFIFNVLVGTNDNIDFFAEELPDYAQQSTTYAEELPDYAQQSTTYAEELPDYAQQSTTYAEELPDYKDVY
ncbi:hypothetical protein ACWFOP_20190 [Bacillus mycoides]